MELQVDEKRWKIKESLLSDTGTGIFVRAKVPSGVTGYKYDSVDIVLLDKDSLLAWLRSHGGENSWAENTVGILLGHGNIAEPSFIQQVTSLIVETAKDLADEVDSHLQNASGDLAYEYSRDDALPFADGQWQDKIKKAKKDGVVDVGGWLADEMYDDVDFLSDMSGDKIHDFARDYKLLTLIEILIASFVKEDRASHDSLIKAMDGHINRWKEYVNKHLRKNQQLK